MSKQPYIPPKPPRWAARLLEWYCKPSLYEDLQGDLLEYFERNVEKRGLAYARLIYLVDVLKFFRAYTVQKPQIIKRMNQFVMFSTYFKTSMRNMGRNRLFTAINIVGLAVSMSVGLLLITIISDFKSYDDFHVNKDRIFRIITKDVNAGGFEMNLASTTAKAWQRINEEIPGVEMVTLLRRGFGQDGMVGDKKIPISAVWADSAFFEVFTFPLLHGNAATALKEPHSLVMTEKSALKVFGKADVVGEVIQFDSVGYTVTAVMADIPQFSHLQFDNLVSLSSFDMTKGDSDGGFFDWKNVYMTYVYTLLYDQSDKETLQADLDLISQEENETLENREISLLAQPMDEMVVGRNLSNPIGPTIHIYAIWVLTALALIIVISACFNYTNLSIARSLRRSREVGIRKVLGAVKSQVRGQFITESIVTSVVALIFAFAFFIILRQQFLGLTPMLSGMVSLTLSPAHIGYFLVFALVVGVLAGFVPAIFFSKINPIKVLKDASGMRVFRHVNLRRVLIVIQYTFSLIFITTTIIGYYQYKGMLSLDLGFSTENILNIRMKGNKPGLLKNELKEIPAITEMSVSRIITSGGSMYGANTRYEPTMDSANVWLNNVDEKYIPLHEYQFVAGGNFTVFPTNGEETQAIVNEQLVKRFDPALTDPDAVLGKQLILPEGKRLTIIGVLKDFHYGSVSNKIEPVAYRYSANEPGGFLNLKINSHNLPGTMAAIEAAWNKIDEVHPLDATFYDDQIEGGYAQFMVMIKVIGFLAFLAICIASIGLFGMVVFTTETRLKEISIRKVLGAEAWNLTFLLGRGFLLLLLIAGGIALPLTWLLFDKVVLMKFVYHAPVTPLQLVSGLILVGSIALLMISSQALKAARTNPAQILRNE